MRRAAKVDANHAAIVAGLRASGIYVESLARLGDGWPDVLCSYLGVLTLLEFKRPRGRLTPAQHRWRARFDPRAPVFTVESLDDALALVRR